MTEYIEREAAIEAAYQGLKRPSNTEEWKRICEQLQNVPTADVAPVRRAKWRKRMEEKETPCYKSFTPIWSCSECGTEYDASFCMTVNFCPNCGAKMTEDHHEQKE